MPASIRLESTVNPVNHCRYFLHSVERVLIKYTLIDCVLQNVVQNLWVPRTTHQQLAKLTIIIESLNDVECIEALAIEEANTFGGEWQYFKEVKKGSLVSAVRPLIYDLFKIHRVKTTRKLFEEQDWNYSKQITKNFEEWMEVSGRKCREEEIGGEQSVSDS